MTFPEIVLLFAITGNGVAVLIAVLKLTTWASSTVATLREKVALLERDPNNDIAGRRVVAEVREDVAAIKAQIADLRDLVKTLHAAP